MANKSFPDFENNPDTVLTNPAPTDLVLLWDRSEPLDINKVKVITFQNLVNLAAQSAIQALVSSQAAGDIFYASTGTALARLAKGTAGQVLKMNSGATAPEWGAGAGRVCIAKNSGSQSFSTDAGLAVTAVALGAEDEDVPGWHNTSTNNSRITVNENGLYLAIGRIYWDGNANETRRLILRKNGSISLALDDQNPVAASFSSTNMIAKIVRLVSSDYLELCAAQSSGVSLSINTAYFEVLQIG